VHDRTERGTRLKWLPVLDEYTRECLSLEVESSLTAKDVVQTLERLVEERGAPELIRSDNGPEFIAAAVKDWIASKGMKTLYIEPGSPWESTEGRWTVRRTAQGVSRRRIKTPTAKASIAGSATSSSTWRPLAANWRRKCSAASTAQNTTITGRTPHWGI
jgi:transposase InsO family protein